MSNNKISKKTLLEESKQVISEELKFHLDNNLSLLENVFRPHSKKFFDLINEVRELFYEGRMELSEEELERRLA